MMGGGIRPDRRRHPTGEGHVPDIQGVIFTDSIDVCAVTSRVMRYTETVGLPLATGCGSKVEGLRERDAAKRQGPA
jgi:hypothetical protein